MANGHGPQWGTLRLLIAIGWVCGMGCSDDGGKPKTDASVRPDGAVAAAEVVVGTTTQLGSLDPASANETFVWEFLLNLNGALYRFNNDTLNYEPWLAAAEPEISDQGKVWRVKLRQGLKFADGTSFNAAAVKYNVDRVLSLDGNGAAYVKDYVDSVAAEGDDTVKFTLKQPLGFFKALLGAPQYAGVNSAALPVNKLVTSPIGATVDDAWRATHIDQNALDYAKFLGLGPYRISRLEVEQPAAGGAPTGYAQIVLKANPDYSPAPPTKTVIIKFFKDGDALAKALRDGEVNVAWNTLSEAGLASLAASPDRFKVVESAGLVAEFFGINHRQAKLQDIKVRKAIAHCVDRSAMAKAWNGFGKPLYSMVPSGLWSHTDPFKTLYGATANMEAAKALLLGAGYTEQSKLSLSFGFAENYPQNAPMITTFKTCLDQTGLATVTMRPMPEADYWPTLLAVDETTKKATHTLDLFWLGWATDRADPDDFVFPFGHSSSEGVGISPSANPAIASALDEMLAAARTSTVFETRKTAYEAIQTYWAEQVITVPAVQRTRVAVAATGYTLAAPGIDNTMRWDTLAKTK